MSFDDYSVYDDCSLPDLTYGSPYYSDSEPDFHIRRRPSIPQALPTNAAKLRDIHLKCDRNLGWNIDWAVAYLVDHINKKHDAAESLKNIRIKAANLAREGLSKAIPYRIFNKLSDVLFAGHLNNAVYLDARSLDSDVSGATYTQSWGPVTSVKRVSIILNSNVLAYARARDIVAILIHHMIHAFFLITCGPQKEEEVSYGRLTHGYHFGMVMYTIRELSGTCGKELDSLDFGHPFTDFPCRRRARGEEEKERWYCSHCHAHVPALSQGQVESWYKKYIEPMQSQSSKSIRLATVQIYNDRRCELETKARARLPDCTDTVEVVYNNTSTLLKKSDVERNALSILRAILSTKSRFLKVEKTDVSSTSFSNFIEFLSTAEWRPTLPHILSSRTTGAPIIMSNFGLTMSGSKSPILDDIKMVKSLPYSEIRTYALSRLHTYETCTDDPIALLEALYAGKEPHYMLKDWGRCFLTKLDTQRISNLQKLQTSPAFTDLLERCGALENEVRKVLERTGSSSSLMLGGMSPYKMLEAAGVVNGVGMGMGGDMLSMQMQMRQQLLLPSQHPSLHQNQQLLLGSISTSSPFSSATNFSSPFSPVHNHINLPSTSSYPTYTSHSAYQSTLERIALQNLERENLRRLDIEREKDRLRETQAQVHAAAMLERFYGRGLGGFVEDSDDGGF